MINQEKFNSIKDSVLTKIKSGQIKMIPKWQFVLKAFMVILGIIILGLALLYLASFIIFTLRQSGAWFAPTFGINGIGAFITSLPWLLIIISILFLAFLEILVRKYSFAYRKPILYSLVALIGFVSVISLIIGQVGFHRSAFKFTKEGFIPFARPFYEKFGQMQADGIYFGEISQLKDSGFLMVNRQEKEYEVLFTPETRFPFGEDFAEGDNVVVLGDLNNSLITADGIREVDEGWHRPPMMNMMPPPSIPKMNRY